MRESYRRFSNSFRSCLRHIDVSLYAFLIRYIFFLGNYYPSYDSMLKSLKFIIHFLKNYKSKIINMKFWEATLLIMWKYHCSQNILKEKLLIFYGFKNITSEYNFILVIIILFFSKYQYQKISTTNTVGVIIPTHWQ